MSKGSSQKTTQKQDFKLPAWYEKAAQDILAQANKVSQGGYIPWMGPDVAALSPNAKAGIQGTDAMSAAFGMPTSGGAAYLPPEQEFAGGVKGYSGLPGFEASMQSLKEKYPAAYEFLSTFNKINQGSSINPTQVTPFQSMLDPKFNATMNAIKAPGMGMPGGKGPNGKNADAMNPFKMISMLGGK